MRRASQSPTTQTLGAAGGPSPTDQWRPARSPCRQQTRRSSTCTEALQRRRRFRREQQLQHPSSCAARRGPRPPDHPRLRSPHCADAAPQRCGRERGRRTVTPAAAAGALAQASRQGAPRNGCPTNVRRPPPLPLRSPKGFPDESAAPPSARPSPLDHTPRRDHLELQTTCGDSIYQPVDRRLASLRAHTTHVASSARFRY